MTEPRVHLRHVRQLRLCAGGARAWCARHGIDWHALRTTGVPAPAIAAVNDAYAQRVLALLDEEAAHGRGR